MENRLRILVVDDNEMLSEGIKDFLTDKGFIAECAYSGKDAITLTLDNIYDIALIDVKLPDITGTDLVQKLTSLSSTMEFIYITAYASLESAIEAANQERVISYETKPVNTNHLLSTLKQVTERRRAEGELKKTMSLLKNVLDATPDMVFVKDLELRTIMANKAFAFAVGKKPEDVLGNNDIENGWDPELVRGNPDKGIRSFENDDREALSGKVIHIPEELVNVGDKTRVFDTKKIPLYDSDGKVIGVLCIARDISDRKKMEETLLRSEKLKSLGSITAGISHEFNNILAVISGNIQLLQMGYKDHHRLMDRLHDIEKSVDNGSSITGRMREFTHPDTSARGFEPADINVLIKQSVKFTMPRWKNMAQIEGLDYNVDMEGMKSVSNILCNPREIGGVFIDIINNALDAMPDGGRLSFRTWGKDDTVFASITDTGKGMTEDVKKSIFDPFFTTRKPEGTGLGLSISYAKVVSCGGNIEVDSEVGSGSTITLQFPLTNKNENLITVPDTKQETIKKSLSILVIDDEDAIRDMLYEFLSEKDHNVKTVDNGADAINMIDREGFDLVLCDLAMPGVNGYEVIKTCNMLSKRPKTCLMTGWNKELRLVADENYKVDFILKKPYQFSELEKHINDQFGTDSQ